VPVFFAVFSVSSDFSTEINHGISVFLTLKKSIFAI